MTGRRHRRRARRLASEIGHAWDVDSLRRWALARMLEQLPRSMLRRAWKIWRDGDDS